MVRCEQFHQIRYFQLRMQPWIHRHLDGLCTREDLRRIELQMASLARSGSLYHEDEECMVR